MMLKTIIYDTDWLLPWLMTAMLAACGILLPISEYPIFPWVPSINATLYWDIRKSNHACIMNTDTDFTESVC